MQSTPEQYVVNLLYRLEDETMRLEAAAKLSQPINLSLEQTVKMLSRPSGALIKPTTLERAERFAGYCVAAGIPVEVANASVLPEANPSMAPQVVNQATPIQANVARGSSSMSAPSQVSSNFSTDPPATERATPMTQPIQQAIPSMPLANPLTGAKAKRTSLVNVLRNTSILLTALPLILVGLVIAFYLYSTLPNDSFDQLNNSMDQFMLTSGVSFQPTSKDEKVFREHLQDIVGLDTGLVSFIDVEPLEGSNFKTVFASRFPNTADQLKKDYDAFRQTPLSQTINPIFKTTSAEAGKESKYTILWVEVYQEPDDGHRVLKYDDGTIIGLPQGESLAAAKKLFRLNVGWISEDSKERIISHIFLILGIIALLILAAVAIASLVANTFAQRITKPITNLTEAASAISLGQLDAPVAVTSNDELGDLAEALDRMRSSLKGAIERLRKRR